MDTYLLTIAIGPVQTLIEAARRTRDLWCGSWVLSECAKAAAKSLHDSGKTKPIFPSSEVDLSPRDFDKEYANIANVVRVEVEDVTDISLLETLAEDAKEAAKQRLVNIGAKAKERFPDLPIRDSLWEVQINDILEVFSVWVKVESNYSAAVMRLNELLQIRKNSRDFSAITQPEGVKQGLPKSSLDGACESVVDLDNDQRKSPRNLHHMRRLGLSIGEELDTIGVIKRLAGNAEQFSPYPRICADDWINGLDKAALSSITECYHPLESQWGDGITDDRATTHVTGNDELYGDLPFDGELLYDFRVRNAIHNALSELENTRLQALENCLKEIKNKPVPYGVILKADGDRMGDLFAAANDANQAEKISKALDSFASNVRKIVQKHRGHAIYAGGDDVLAMLPLSTSIDCADSLQKSFKDSMQEVIKDLKLNIEQAPTLSVGIAVGHFMQPLSHLRARAIRAEKLAKGNNLPKEKQRNALGICLGLRSGPEITWRCQWTEQDTTLKLFKDFLTCYAGDRKETVKIEKSGRIEDKTITSSLPTRAGYAIRKVALDYQWSIEKGEKISPLQQAEFKRLLDNLQQTGGEESITQEMKAELQQQANRVGLDDLANQLIIARWLSARIQSDLGAME